MTRRDSPRPQPVATMAREANPSCERQPRRGRGVLRRDPDRHGAGLLRRHQTPATTSRQRAATWTAAPTVGVVGYDAVESGRRAPIGLPAPASNNAAMHLAPDQISAVSGLRSMFRQTGSIIAVSVTTAVVAASSNPG